MMEHPEHIEVLMMKAVDGVLTEHEQRELHAYLADHPEAQTELEDHMSIKTVTDSMAARIIHDAQIEPYRVTGAAKRWLNIAMLAMLGGITLVLGFTSWNFFRADDVPLILKLGMGLLGAGSLMTFVYALSVRLRGAPKDPYGEIDL